MAKSVYWLFALVVFVAILIDNVSLLGAKLPDNVDPEFYIRERKHMKRVLATNDQVLQDEAAPPAEGAPPASDAPAATTAAPAASGAPTAPPAAATTAVPLPVPPPVPDIPGGATASAPPPAPAPGGEQVEPEVTTSGAMERTGNLKAAFNVLVFLPAIAVVAVLGYMSKQLN